MTRGGVSPVVLLANGIHDHPRPVLVRSDPVDVKPHLEPHGNGWVTVHGGFCGPFDIYGRESAERALAKIITDRAALDALFTDVGGEG